jgi:hypothetical protein
MPDAFGGNEIFFSDGPVVPLPREFETCNSIEGGRQLVAYCASLATKRGKSFTLKRQYHVD